MNAQLFALLAEKNSGDLETILQVVGLANLMKIAPNIMNILGTVQDAQKALAVAVKPQ